MNIVDNIIDLIEKTNICEFNEEYKIKLISDLLKLLFGQFLIFLLLIIVIYFIVFFLQIKLKVFYFL